MIETSGRKNVIKNVEITSKPKFNVSKIYRSAYNVWGCSWMCN